MKLRCKLFGHTPPRYYGHIHYGRVIPEGIDGIGVEHARVEAVCSRCNDKYEVIRIHLPPEKARV